MLEENNIRLLPLGSFVRVENHGDEIFVLLARALTKDENDILSANYRLASRPLGDMPGSDLLFIKDSEIAEIVFEGYSDELDEEFLKQKIGEAEDSTPTPKRKIEDIPEPDFSQLLDFGKTTVQVPGENVQAQEAEALSEKLRKDPFYKFKQEGNQEI